MIFLCVQSSTIVPMSDFQLQKGRCCDTGQNDTIGRIEVTIVIARMTFNSYQLFDEHRVNGDYH